jgi:hypothetical protein
VRPYLIGLKKVLRAAWSGWMEGDNIPIAVGLGRTFDAASGKPYSSTSGWDDLIDKRKDRRDCFRRGHHWGGPN